MTGFRRELVTSANSLFACCAVALLCVALWAPHAQAYPAYDDGAGNGCVQCHPGFQGGGPGLHSNHRNQFGLTSVPDGCNACHPSGPGSTPVLTYSSGPGGGLGCVGCHGRDYGETSPNSGNPKATGYGLRQHHVNNSVPGCPGCHVAGSLGHPNPLPAILPESVAPPYYGVVTSALTNPCDSAEEDLPFDGDSVGLDNDGNGLIDYPADPACAPPTTTTTTLPPDFLSLGKKVLVKGNLPSQKRIIVALAKEKGTDIGDPDQKGLDPIDDPVVNGASLNITVNGNGGTDSSQTFDLPAGSFGGSSVPGWKTLAVGFKYLDPKNLNGPAKIVLIKRTPGDVFLMKAVIKGLDPTGGLLDVTVEPPNGGTPDATMALQITGGHQYCASWGGAAGGDFKKNDLKVFKVINGTGEVPCPVP